ncbi:hypothetical protein SAMN05444172_1393 [Burkholderia sp. GAS332]|nr:hypothetical protein SAMN05444172_1393 [Burkholderia sp. GAS332]
MDSSDSRFQDHGARGASGSRYGGVPVWEICVRSIGGATKINLEPDHQDAHRKILHAKHR